MRESAIVRQNLPPKYFIGHNTHQIKAIEADMKENRRSDNQYKQDLQAYQKKDRGSCPKYL